MEGRVKGRRRAKGGFVYRLDKSKRSSETYTDITRKEHGKKFLVQPRDSLSFRVIVTISDISTDGNSRGYRLSNLLGNGLPTVMTSLPCRQEGSCLHGIGPFLVVGDTSIRRNKNIPRSQRSYFEIR